jgi:UbiD family decarboxylase
LPRSEQTRLRHLLTSLSSVIQLDGPLDDQFEISRQIVKAGINPILFRKPFGKQEDIAANLYASKSGVARCLNLQEKEVLRLLGRMVAKPTGEYVRADMGLFQEAKGLALPTFQYYRSDAGRYVTSSVLLAQDPDTEFVNMSVHRMLVLNARRFVVRMVEGRHLHRIFTKNKERSEDTPIAVLVGCRPEVMIAACCQSAWGETEMKLASALAGGSLTVVEPPGLGFAIPAQAEYLMTGTISKDQVAPERQVDILGTLDSERRQPIVNVTGFFYKENPIYHAILPGGYEHRVLMGMPRAAAIWTGLERRGIYVEDLSLTPGSGGWLHCVISIRKKSKTDGREAILTALNSHGSVKGVVVVDDDVNPNEYEAVDFALATRLSNKGQLMYFEGLRGSTLDPSADRESHATLKWGLDLTLEPGPDKNRFRKEHIV